MSSQFWIAIAVVGAFALLRWLVPTKPRPPAEQPLSDSERATFQRWEIAALVPFFVFATALGLAWYALLREVAWLSVAAAPDTVYLITPSAAYWGIPAIFLGMITAAVPFDWRYRVLLHERYRRFERYCDERTGLNGRRVFIGFSVAIGVGTVLFLLCGVTSITRIKTTGIEVGHALSFRRAFYSYNHVKTIRHLSSFLAPNGSVVRRPHYVIICDDGEQWSTRQGLRDPIAEFDASVMSYVAQRSGLSIEVQR
jgi:hypothetical protein